MPQERTTVLKNGFC